MLLVHTNESDQNQTVNENIKTELNEVLFLMSSNTGLDVDFNNVDKKALHYLQHRITRNPDDLRSHVQRIQLNLSIQDSDGVFGSILDLFIALSDKGIAIRRRMLSVARPQLSMLHRVFLSNSLQSGLSSSDILPDAPCSALSLGYTGTQSIVLENDACSDEELDPIKLAKDYVEYGQIDDAKELLESAVVAQPWRKEVHTELLNLYRATHDSIRSEKMYQKLAGSSIPDHIAWKETLQYVRQTAEKS